VAVHHTFILCQVSDMKLANELRNMGITATLRYYADKYKDVPLTETTVRRLKGLYKDMLKPKAKSKKAKDTKTLEDQTGDESENSDKEVEEVEELPRKKTGRPLLLGAELDTQV